MSYCPYCKNPLQPNWSYCHHCNKPLIVNLQNRFERRAQSLSHFQHNFEKEIDQRTDSSPSPSYRQDEGYLKEIMEIDTTLQEKQDLGAPVGDLLLKKASVFYQNRNLNSALNILESALKSYEIEQDGLKIAIAHNEIGIIQEDLGLFDNSIYHFQNAIEELKKINEYSHLVQIYNNLANTHFALHELEDSFKYYTEAIQIAERENLLLERIKTSSNLVDVLILLKRYDAAKDILQSNLRFFQQQKDLYGMILTITKFGKLYYNLGSNYYEQAYQSFTDTLDLIDKIRPQISVYIGAQMEWECYYFLGKLNLLWNNDKSAEDFLLKSLESVRTFAIEENLIEGIILESLAELYEMGGKNEKAIDYFNLSIEIYEKYGDDNKIAENKYNIGHIYFDILENDQKALNYLEQSLEIYEYLGYTKEMADILHKIGDIFVYKEDLISALSYFRDAQKLYQDIFDAVNTDLVSEKIRSITDNYSATP